MGMTPLESGGRRRIVIVDLDWRESDLVPSLARDPAYSVALVAGASADDPGLRVARLCGLPHTSDLADLTREIFDLALVGSRSPRREHIQRLLAALGTPVCEPDALVSMREHPERRHATDGAVDADRAFDEAFPDVADPPPGNGDGPAHEAHPVEAVPPPGDAPGLERWLARLRDRTRSGSAELHVGTAEGITRVCRVGPEDVLIDALVGVADRVGAPQVVERLGGIEPRRAWGAWPLRIGARCVVVAAGGFDPVEGPARWSHAVEQLGLAWTADPAGPAAAPACLAPESFAARVRLAAERSRREAFSFSVHRLRFDGPQEAVDILCGAFPAHLRGSDGLCRSGPTEALLIFCGSDTSYGALRRRLVAAWEASLREVGVSRPPEPIVDERLVLEDASQIDRFLQAAGHWMRPA